MIILLLRLLPFESRDYKVGQRDYKVGQTLGLQSGARWDYKVGQLFGLQSGAKRLQSGAGITKWGKGITKWGRDYKVGQGLQSGAVQHCIIDFKKQNCNF